MKKLIRSYYSFHNWLFSKLKHLDGLPALLIRLYLVPVFWMAGTNKIDFATLMPYEGVVSWFASLGMPLPGLMAFLAGWTEVLGAILLAVGLATRWISIPLMITMLVAALTVHWDNGWAAIASSSDPEVAERLSAAKSILKEHGHYGWLTGKGDFAILQNGIEFAATYFIMLLTLLFTGGGRYFSVDYWLSKVFSKEKAQI
ncbi:MAG: DoxX family protein [Kangiellaceae bacterium]|nr:DoxX family protein [Kangiellaceae bacterium]